MIETGATFKRGDTIRFRVTLTDGEGDPFDYSAEGVAVRAEFRPHPTSATVVVPDQDATDAASGVLLLTVPYAASEAMAARKWTADIEVTDAGVRVSSQTFGFTIEQDVTWPEEEP